MIFTKELVNLDPYFINIYTNEVRNPNTVWLILQPGQKNGSFIENYKDLFNEKDLVISPDYPGRGDSGRYGGDSILNITKGLALLCEKKKLYNLNIIAFSFGTMVATQLAVNYQNYINKMFLFAPGEYFSPSMRVALKTLFKLPAKQPKLLKIVRYILLHLRIFESFHQNNLDLINAQWIDTLSYKLQEKIINIPTTLINFTKDKVVDKKSKLKLEKIFAKATQIQINSKHPAKVKDFLELRELVKTFVS